MNILEAEILQRMLSHKVIQNDEFNQSIKIVAGCDVEYNTATDLVAGAIVLLDYETKKIIEVVTHAMKVTFPYVAGLFSFREMPPLLEAYKKLRLVPDIIICDAQGIAHPRGLGLASHLGIVLNVPTIGCAKKRLFGNYEMPETNRGAMSDLLHEETQQIIGKVVRTQENIKPVFVSVGHKVSLNTACNIILELCLEYRLPETTRIADAYALEAFKKYA